MTDAPLAFRTDGGTAPPAAPAGVLAVRTAARSLQGMQKEALVACGPQGPRWRLVCDEGPWLNGSDLAPFPLAFFTAGLAAGWLAAFAALASQRELSIAGLELTVDNRYGMEGAALKGTMRGSALPAEVTFSGAAVDPTAVEALACEAIAATPYEACLRTALASTFTLTRNGEAVGLPDALAAQGPAPGDPAPLFAAAAPLASGDDAAEILRKLGGPETDEAAAGAPVGLQAEQKRTVHVSGTATLRADGLQAIAVRCIRPAGSLFEILAHEPLGERAPSAAALVSAGLAFCFMTQLGRYASIAKQDVSAYRIVQDTVFAASTAGAPVTHVFIDGNEPDDGLRTLLRMGAQTCYLHAAYRGENETRVACRARQSV